MNAGYRYLRIRGRGLFYRTEICSDRERRARDLNPRYLLRGTRLFESRTLSHSDNSPYVPAVLFVKYRTGTKQSISQKKYFVNKFVTQIFLLRLFFRKVYIIIKTTVNMNF